MTSPHRLPDVCLLIVFDKIPLHQVFFLNRVCWQWYHVTRSACARRRKCTLWFGTICHKLLFQTVRGFNPFVPYAWDNWSDSRSPMRNSWITRRFTTDGEHQDIFVQQLAAKLPNITSLELILIFDSIEVLELTTYLLRLWTINRHSSTTTHGLVRLKYWAKFTKHLTLTEELLEQWTHNWFLLVARINTLSTLKYLTFVDHYPIRYVEYDRGGWPVFPIQLPNLIEINFTVYDINSKMVQSLVRYAQKQPSLRSIGFGHCIENLAQVHLLLHCTRDRQIAARITYLHFKCIQIDLDSIPESVLSSICARMHNLTSLWLAVNEIQISAVQWSACLSQCPQLRQLRACIAMNESSNRQTDQITQLPSITELSLDYYIHNYSHNNIRALCLDWTFPNLKHIHINEHNGNTCTLCDPKGKNYDYISRRAYTFDHECHQLFMSPLKLSTQLQIKYTCITVDMFYTIDNIL